MTSDFLEFVQQFMRVETNNFGKCQKFHHVEPTLAILDVGDERLMATESRGDSGLRHPGLLSLFNQQSGQAAVAF